MQNASDSAPVTYTTNVKAIANDYSALSTNIFYVMMGSSSRNNYFTVKQAGSFRTLISYNSSTGIVTVTVSGNAIVNEAYMNLYMLENVEGV